MFRRISEDLYLGSFNGKADSTTHYVGIRYADHRILSVHASKDIRNLFNNNIIRQFENSVDLDAFYRTVEDAIDSRNIRVRSGVVAELQKIGWKDVDEFDQDSGRVVINLPQGFNLHWSPTSIYIAPSISGVRIPEAMSLCDLYLDLCSQLAALANFISSHKRIDFTLNVVDSVREYNGIRHCLIGQSVLRFSISLDGVIEPNILCSYKASKECSICFNLLLPTAPLMEAPVIGCKGCSCFYHDTCLRMWSESLSREISQQQCVSCNFSGIK